MLIKKGEHDIATAEWLLRTLGGNHPLAEMPKFNRKDVYHATPATCQEIRNNFDKFDDSYTEPFNGTEELVAFFDKMDTTVSLHRVIFFIWIFSLNIFCFQ